MKVCGTPGCPELTKTSYCETHMPVQSHGWHTSTRVSPPGWEKARRRTLRAARYRCYRCGGRATIADHYLPLAWGGAPTDGHNLRAMCQRCHKAKTQHESALGKKLKGVSGPERMKLIDPFLEEWE